MKNFSKILLPFLLILLIVAGCGSKKSSEKTTQIKLGVVGAKNEVWEDVAKRLKKDRIDLKIVSFSDYNQPNAALADGEIDLNSFQHQFFLDNYNKEHKTDLVSIGNTMSAPMGIYSDSLKDIKKIKDGGKISIPNDATNGGRALNLLQAAGLIKLDEKKKNLPTVNDITENKKQIKITELDASQIARSLKDVDAAVINSGMAVDAGLVPDKDAIFLEPVNEKARPYVNIIAAKKKDVNNKIYQKVIAAYQSEDTKKVIKATSKGADVPAWEKFGKK